MTTLVAVGCSHTYGSALDGYAGIEKKDYNKAHCFAGLLHKKYNFTNYYNCGLPGGSNQYIMRTVSSFLQNHKQDSDDYLFLIGWTSTTRFELRYPDDVKFFHSVRTDLHDKKYIPFSLGTDEKLYHTGEVRRLSGYAPLIFDDQSLNDDWAAYAFSLQQMLKLHNIKYYMFNTCHDLPVTNWNKPIIEKLDTTHYYNPTDFDSSMLYWALNKDFEKTNCWHLKQDGHQAWMEFLEEKLQGLGYL